MRKISITLFFVAIISFGLTQQSFGDILPSISVGDCEGAGNCSQPVNQYGSGQTIVQFSYDFTTLDKTVIKSAEAGAGGGLEPAVSARAYVQNAATEAYAKVNDWRYQVSGPAESIFAFLNIAYNFSIEGTGIIAVSEKSLRTGWGSAIRIYAERQFMNGQFMYRRWPAPDAWFPSPTSLEGSYIYPLTEYVNSPFYLSMSVLTSASSQGSSGYSQVALDPYVMLDPNNPDNSPLFEVTTIRGVNDFSLITPLRGSALVSPVPVPAAVWLLGSGLIGLIGLKRKYLG